MKNEPRAVIRLGWPAYAAALMLSSFPAASAQETASAGTGDVVELSPFEINTAEDQGYRATNSISGTRLNTAIKDLPMPLEVITEEFIRDTGSTNLRNTLSYSAGIILESQNDAGAGNSFGDTGGVHNPEGATNNKTQTTFKVRGFLTDAVLRDGYRRQHATDSINIGRVEVVRGPAALLYGIGNFGGIVNYMPKQPALQPRNEVGLTLGTNSFKRVTIDSTGPIGDKMELAYRLTGAWEDTASWTDFNTQDHYFVSPVFSFRPTPKTKVSVDYEYGEEHRDGIGFQSVRARANVVGQQDRLERAGFVHFEGKDPRTFRWSGPDTFLDTEASNLNLQATHEITKDLNFLVGYNKSKADFNGRDVGGGLVQNEGPVALRSTVTVNPLDALNGDSEFEAGPIPDAIFQYNWNTFNEKNDREQVRVELNYRFRLFERNDWLNMEHSFLLGRSEERAEKSVRGASTAAGNPNWKSPTDTSYIRFATQGDGSPSSPITPTSLTKNTAWNQGTYLVHQGRFLRDRVTTVAGIRRDRNDLISSIDDFRAGTSTVTDREVQTDNTTQWGVSVQVTPQVSLFALQAEGLQPNFEGNRDALGNPIGAVMAESKEAGVKVDLFNGRVSGTVSAYRIQKTGTPIFYWWAPSPAKGRFDPNKPIVYNVNDFNPVTGEADFKNGALTAARSQWDAAVSSGAAFQKDGNWYINASNAAGAAYMDKVFAETAQRGGWPGWLYNRYDPNINFATLDWASGEDTPFQAYAVGDEESSGWDAQLMLSPVDNFQMLVTYSQTTRQVVNAGKFAQYPYPEDRWAVWYFPNDQWGLTGFAKDLAYGDPTDTSTWQGRGYGAGEKQDDTPLHALSFWGNYRFTAEPLKGLSVGLGGQWTDRREYFSGITDGSGQLVVDGEGKRVILYTKDRLNVDAMLRYEFRGLGDRDCALQLNVYNLLNDKDLYGLIYAPGRSAKLEFTMAW